jgi:hypothetical protein
MITKKQALLWVLAWALSGRLLWAAGVQAADAATYYVESYGNDDNSGLSRAAPFKTLAKALDSASKSRIKHITVVGTLTEQSECLTGFPRDSESVFSIENTGRTEITIRGINQGKLTAVGTGKRVVKIKGTSRIRFEYLALADGNPRLDPGGGLYLGDGAAAVLGTGAVVRDNSASLGGGVFVLGAGGAEAGDFPSGLVIDGGKVLYNRAAGFQGEAGGGIYVRYGSCRMRDGEVAENTAEDDNGGGILVKQGALEVSGGTVRDNRGGGVYVIETPFVMGGGVIRNNQASHKAGGAAIALSAFTMTGGGIMDNRAGGEGGGIFMFRSTAALSGGEIAGNSAEYGGGVYVDATYNHNESLDFEMKGGIIRDNAARKSGGGIFVLNGALSLGGAAVVDHNTAVVSGGGVGIENSSLLLKDRIVIQRNGLVETDRSGAGDSGGYGGGIHIATGVLEFSGGLITRNTGSRGGGVSARDCAFTMAGGATMNGNRASRYGGAVFFSGNGTFEMTGGEITRNSASESGGGLYIGGYHTALLAGGLIGNNTASGEGGGLAVRPYTIVTLTGTAIRGNKAREGGGVRIWEQGTVSLWDRDPFDARHKSVITGNEAERGGGIYGAKDAAFTRNGGSFQSNKPDDVFLEP